MVEAELGHDPRAPTSVLVEVAWAGQLGSPEMSAGAMDVAAGIDLRDPADGVVLREPGLVVVLGRAARGTVGSERLQEGD